MQCNALQRTATHCDRSFLNETFEKRSRTIIQDGDAHSNDSCMCVVAVCCSHTLYVVAAEYCVAVEKRSRTIIQYGDAHSNDSCMYVVAVCCSHTLYVVAAAYCVAVEKRSRTIIQVVMSILTIGIWSLIFSGADSISVCVCLVDVCVCLVKVCVCLADVCVSSQ